MNTLQPVDRSSIGESILPRIRVFFRCSSSGSASAGFRTKCAAQRSSSSRSNRSLARTGSCARRRQAATIAAMQRRVGSIRPMRIRKRCWRLYPDSRARCAGLIPRLFKYCSSRVGMCNIVHRMPMHDRCQSLRAEVGTKNRSILAIKGQNPAFVTSFLSNHHPMFPFAV